MDARLLNPFAAVEQSINAGVQAMLANAVAVYEGGAPFGVLFDAAPTDEFGGAVDSATRTCEFEAARAPGIAEGSTLTVGGVAYTVASSTEPDESGWLRITLYPTA